MHTSKIIYLMRDTEETDIKSLTFLRDKENLERAAAYMAPPEHPDLILACKSPTLWSLWAHFTHSRACPEEALSAENGGVRQTLNTLASHVQIEGDLLPSAPFSRILILAPNPTAQKLGMFFTGKELPFNALATCYRMDFDNASWGAIVDGTQKCPSPIRIYPH